MFEDEIEIFSIKNLFVKGQVFEGKNGRISITKQKGPNTWFVSYQDFLLPSLSFTDWIFSIDELEIAIQKVQLGDQLIFN